VAKKAASPHPIFSIRFTEGLATRNRLPLDHVIRVLTEIRGMLESVGKQVQRSRGVADPTGDFGLELIGGFQKGSVKAALALTKDVEAGVIAAGYVLDTVTRLGTFDPPKSSKAVRADGLSTDTYDPRLMTRLGSIGKVQEIDKTRVEMALRANGGRAQKAVFDRRTSQVLNKMREPNFAIEDVTVYGKLRELRDRATEGEEDKKTFYGELLGDDGNVWRIDFSPRDASKAAELFRKQVYITGNLTYFKALNPRISARDFGLDLERNYVAAFDAMYGSGPELANIDLDTLIRELETE
jgi:hypothetical protein